MNTITPRFQGLCITNDMFPGDYSFDFEQNTSDEVTLKLAYLGGGLTEERVLKWRSPGVETFWNAFKKLKPPIHPDMFNDFKLDDIRPVVVKAMNDSPLPQNLKDFFLTKINSSDFHQYKLPMSTLGDTYAPKAGWQPNWDGVTSYAKTLDPALPAEDRKNRLFDHMQARSTSFAPEERELHGLAKPLNK